MQPTCVSVVLVLSLLVGAAASSGASFDLAFTAQQWKQDRPHWSGDLDLWEQQLERGQPALASLQAGGVIRRVLPQASDDMLQLAIEYGWLSGRGPGVLEVGLEDPAGRGVVVVMRQSPGRKYQIVWKAGPEPQMLGHLDDPRLDAGLHSSGTTRMGAVAQLRLAADGRRLTLQRLGGGRVDVDLPEAITPTHVSLVDRSPGNEQARLGRLRAFTGPIDPTPHVAELRMPFGASFVEQREVPTVRILGRWVSDESRPARLELTAEPLPRQDSSPAHRVQVESDLRPGEVAELELSALSDLSPGLYSLRGDLYVADRRVPVDARLAILSRDLADRPHEQIPPWMGMVPLINLLERDLFPEAFEFMHKIGVRHVRWLPGWGRIEPEKDRYEWDESDEFMGLCAKYDMQAMFCLSYFGAPWTVQATGGQRARSPEGRQMWVERFAVPTIARYGDRVKLWQIWNEPDAFWNEDPSQARGFADAFATPANYMDLVKRTHIAAHALGIPDLRVMASLSSGEIQRNTRLLFSLGLGDHFDGMIIHTYGHHVRHFENLRRLLAELGQEDPWLGSGETGLPRGSDWDGAMRQAQKVVQTMMSSVTIPNLLCVHQFVLHDSVAGGSFGAVNVDHQPHPQATAYFTIARLLSGATSGSIDTRGLLTIYRVERQGRAPLVAVANPGQSMLITFEAPGDEQPVVWNLLGQPSRPQVTDGTFTLDVTDCVMIEGDVAPKATISPAMTMSLSDDGSPVVDVAIGADRELREARIGLVVPEIGYERHERVSATGHAVFTLPATMEQGRSYSAEIVVAVGQSRLSQPTTIEFIPIHQVTESQARSLTPPDDLPVIHITGPEVFRRLGAHRVWGGPQDNSAQLRFGWTPEELVLWIEQEDDIHVPIPVGVPNPFGYDSGYWAFQPDGHLAAGMPFIEVLFGIQTDGKPFARVLGQPHYSPSLLAERSGTTTRYRVSIPAAQIGVVPAAGVSLGMAVNLQDNDGDGRKGWIVWGEGIWDQKNPARYRRVLLKPPVNATQ